MTGLEIDPAEPGYTHVLIQPQPGGGLTQARAALNTVYERDGRPVRRIGRPGEGPGEFGRVGRLGVVGDNVWVYDAGLRRLTLFDRAGSVLSTAMIRGVSVTMPNSGVTGRVTPRAMRPDGLFTSDMTSFTFTPGADGTGMWTDTVLVPRVLFDAAGNAVDTDDLGVPWLVRFRYDTP